MSRVSDALLTVIREFQSRVAAAAGVFQAHGYEDMLSAWRSRRLPQVGYIDADRRYHYAFHGIGCAFTFPSGEVLDWDFGHGDRIDGFDEWRLQQFLEDRPELQRVLPLSMLRSEFQGAIRAGTIVSPGREHHDSLYYVSDDVTAKA